MDFKTTTNATPRKPDHDTSHYLKRREALASSIGDGILIVAAQTEQVRNSSVHQVFRQTSNFYYLTGFDEPDAVFVFRPGKNPETVIFTHDKDPTHETWEGFRFGPQVAASVFKIDHGESLGDLEKKLVGLIKGCDKVYYEFGVNQKLDAALPQLLDSVKRSYGRSGLGLLPIFDARDPLGRCRLVKSELEIKDMKKACSISQSAHVAMMRECRVGRTERYLQGVFYEHIFKLGARGHAYPPIIAGGNNATTLHYRFNDQELKDGDLVLIDAGCEYNYYASDITRTFPVNGKFSEAQAKVYDCVLNIQKQTIAMVTEGLRYQDLRDASTRMLIEAMLELGLLKGNPSEILENESYRRYYPHGIGHWLGLDVHDAGTYMDSDGVLSARLAAGNVLTIEPGLYIPANDELAPKEYRGIGVRIEDNILVNEKGSTNLSISIPKERKEIEELVGTL